jgi:hypothetical protein
MLIEELYIAIKNKPGFYTGLVWFSVHPTRASKYFEPISSKLETI